MTDAEQRLWRRLRDLKGDGVHFRKQAPIGKYIVDFCCHSERLVIEVDGGQHGNVETGQYDQTRTAWLRGEGYRVLRFWNNDTFENLDGVMETIASALSPHPNPSPLGGGAFERSQKP